MEGSSILIIAVLIALMIAMLVVSLVATSKKRKQKSNALMSTEQAPAVPVAYQSMSLGSIASSCNIGAFRLFFRILLVIFVSLITLGIASSWMEVWLLKWVASKTSIDGKVLAYQGTGGEWFVKKLVWHILFVITIGIYGFWLPSKFIKYHISKLHFEI